MALIVPIGTQKCEALFYNSTGKLNITQKLLKYILQNSLLQNSLLQNKIDILQNSHFCSKIACCRIAKYETQHRCFFLGFGEYF